MQIDPKLALWLNVAYGLLSAATVSVLAALGIPDASVVAAWCGAGAFALNLVLHSLSSTTAGPLAAATAAAAKPDPNEGGH